MSSGHRMIRSHLLDALPCVISDLGFHLFAILDESGGGSKQHISQYFSGSHSNWQINVKYSLKWHGRQFLPTIIENSQWVCSLVEALGPKCFRLGSVQAG